MSFSGRNLSTTAYWLIPIFLAAAFLRLSGVSFGLPALLDPDEPIFLLCALKLLREPTLNPGWFGHPGTTTIYTLALIEGGTFLTGYLLGLFANPSDFIQAIYHNPSIVFLPARIFFVLCGTGCVVLTFLAARRAFDIQTAILAATLLAINALHIQWSQVIRTDVHAGFFMLLCVLFAIGIVRHGRPIDYIAAAIAAGLACATKWPAATVAIAIAVASLAHVAGNRGSARSQLALVAASLPVFVGTLLLTSPYLLFDYQTVIANVGGEAQLRHVGSTGGSFIENAGWYILGPLLRTFGPLGLLAAALGALAILRGNRTAAATILVPAATFLAAICTQNLVWERWLVPILPMVAILSAVGTVAVARRVNIYLRYRSTRSARAVHLILLAALTIPMALATRGSAAERSLDTRTLASQWIFAHVPTTETIAIEHFAFDLAQRGYRIRYTAGAGCVDPLPLLTGNISYAEINRMRANSAVTDFGTTDTRRIATCRARYVVTVHYDRYLAERDDYGAELDNYRRLLAGARQVAIFQPVSGHIGGPVTRIFELAPKHPQ